MQQQSDAPSIDTRKAVGERLRALRRRVSADSGLKVWEIANGAHMSEQAWYQRERGETSISLDEIPDLARGLRLDEFTVHRLLSPTQEPVTAESRFRLEQSGAFAPGRWAALGASA